MRLSHPLFSILATFLMPLGAIGATSGSPTLPTLDLSKNFQNTTLNLATETKYANGVTVVVPPAASEDDQFMVSIQQNDRAQCTTSGVMNKKSASGALIFYVVIHVLSLPDSGGHCFIGVHARNRDVTKRAFIDLMTQANPQPPQPQQQ